jgi:hypothetical protein
VFSLRQGLNSKYNSDEPRLQSVKDSCSSREMWTNIIKLFVHKMYYYKQINKRYVCFSSRNAVDARGM